MGLIYFYIIVLGIFGVARDVGMRWSFHEEKKKMKKKKKLREGIDQGRSITVTSTE